MSGANKDEQIAILSLLLDTMTRRDASASSAAKAAYLRYRGGDMDIRFVVELEPGVWHREIDGDPGRTLDGSCATTYGARRAIAVLANARRYRPFEHARIVPPCKGQGMLDVS